MLVSARFDREGPRPQGIHDLKDEEDGMLGILLLALSAMLMTFAVLRRMESTLLAAIIAYAGTGVYIIEVEPGLLVLALVLALVVAVVALARLLTGQPPLADGPDAAFFIDRG